MIRRTITVLTSGLLLGWACACEAPAGDGIGDGVSTARDAAEGRVPGEVCEPPAAGQDVTTTPDGTCASESWQSTAFSEFWVSMSEPGLGPAPIYGENCELVLDVSCRSVCDCKYVFLGCEYLAANIELVGVRFDRMVPQEDGRGPCVVAPCGGTTLPSSDSRLDCVESECVAIDPVWGAMR